MTLKLGPGAGPERHVLRDRAGLGAVGGRAPRRRPGDAGGAQLRARAPLPAVPGQHRRRLHRPRVPVRRAADHARRPRGPLHGQAARHPDGLRRLLHEPRRRRPERPREPRGAAGDGGLQLLHGPADGRRRHAQLPVDVLPRRRGAAPAVRPPPRARVRGVAGRDGHHARRQADAARRRPDVVRHEADPAHRRSRPHRGDGARGARPREPAAARRRRDARARHGGRAAADARPRRQRRRALRSAGDGARAGGDAGARRASGASGPRYHTNTMLRFRADHAAAKDAVLSEVDPELLAQLGMFEVASRAPDKATFLQRPDLGRALSDEGARRDRPSASAARRRWS